MLKVAWKPSPPDVQLGRTTRLSGSRESRSLKVAASDSSGVSPRSPGFSTSAADTVITRAGEPGDEFFLIVDGTARVDVSAEKHVPLHPGEFFGEMSLLDGGPRSATVVAATPVRLLVISRRHFSVLLKEVPGLTQTLLTTLSRRVRPAEEEAERLRSASTGL